MTMWVISYKSNDWLLRKMGMNKRNWMEINQHWVWEEDIIKTWKNMEIKDQINNKSLNKWFNDSITTNN